MIRTVIAYCDYNKIIYSDHVLRPTVETVGYVQRICVKSSSLNLINPNNKIAIKISAKSVFSRKRIRIIRVPSLISRSRILQILNFSTKQLWTFQQSQLKAFFRSLYHKNVMNDTYPSKSIGNRRNRFCGDT